MEHTFPPVKRGRENVAICPECNNKKLYWNSKTHLFNCKVCGHSGNALTAGFRTNTERPEFTETEKRVYAYHKETGKNHRLSDKVLKHFKVKPFEQTSKGGKKYQALCLVNADNKPLKRLIGAGWIQFSRKDQPPGIWLNTHNIKPTEKRIYVLAGEWDLFSFWEHTGIDGISPIGGETRKNFPTAELEIFAHKEIIILYDNDTAGRTGGLNLARAITRHVKTEWIKIVDIAELIGLNAKAGDDIDDYFSGGGTKERLFQVIDETGFFNKTINFDYSALPERKTPAPEIDAGLSPEQSERLWKIGGLSGLKRNTALVSLAGEIVLEPKSIPRMISQLKNIILEMESLSQKEQVHAFIESSNIVMDTESEPKEPFYFDKESGYYKSLNTGNILTKTALEITENTSSPGEKIYNTNLVKKSLIEHIKTKAIIERPAVKFEDDNLAVMTNSGVLRIDPETFNPEIISPFNGKPPADFYFTGKVPLKYNTAIKETDSEYILPTLRNSVSPESLRLLQQISGCILFGHSLQIITWLKGEGGDGKSLFINTLSELLENNTETGKVDELTGNRFAVQRLYMKKVFFVQETDNKEKVKESTLKQISGGDRLTADRKFVDPIIFTNRAIPVFAANNPPVLGDTSRGMYRRLVYIEFSEIQGKKDPNYFKKNILGNEKELQAFFDWCLNGYIDFLKNGLSETTENTKLKNEVRANSSPVSEYWMEKIENTRNKISAGDALDLSDLFIEKLHVTGFSGYAIDHTGWFHDFKLWAEKVGRGINTGQRGFATETYRVIESVFRGEGYNISVKTSNNAVYLRNSETNAERVYKNNLLNKWKSEYNFVILNEKLSESRKLTVIEGIDADKLFFELTQPKKTQRQIFD